MLNVLRLFRKNNSLLGQKSTLLLLLAMALVFSEGCSRKLPCPDVNKATAKAKKGTKKKKKARPANLADPDNPNPDDASQDATASADATDNATASLDDAATTESKPKASLTAKKNRYNKNGLLQKGKYKKLRNNPARKVKRKGNFFTDLFSGKKTKKTKKTKSRPEPNVEPVDE
ncbi:hypothetical protein [Adhaeribacter soli]|uniref:Uncharacterized protein n=1 Tax=Adhaeribacter soli TaxID=2607655 RepID=A0A5N1IQD1_9BACT|nr:hypothetical protein [Adhaeribacter soli]KAA9331968.1 hypothetical protein F0P94_14330 [Adhaeribacter soli]